MDFWFPFLLTIPKHRFLQALVVLTFLLLFAGGLVTSTRSGLAVPDWPLSFGGLFPPLIGGVRFEHTHRVIAATVGFLTLILTLWIGRTEPRKKIRWLAIACLGAVVLQGILGGLTVIHRLPVPVSVAHACLGPVFFTLIVVLAARHSPHWKEGLPPDPLSWLLVGTVFCQMVLGAVVRHTGTGVGFHITLAFLVLFLAAVSVRRSFNRTSFLLGLLVTVEFFLGIGAFVFTRMEGVSQRTASVLFPTIHQTLGALILATAVVGALKGQACEPA